MAEAGSTAGPASSPSGPVRVVFVCWGNICRSPMAERIARKEAAEAGLENVEFTSAATSREELGAPMDSRAAQVLQENGYPSRGHVAHQITAAEIDRADLVIAMEDIHVRKMLAMDPGADNISLLTDYDPSATPGSGVPDPWYGTKSGFYDTLAALKAAMPGILDRVRQIQAARQA